MSGLVTPRLTEDLVLVIRGELLKEYPKAGLHGLPYVSASPPMQDWPRLSSSARYAAR